MYFGWIGVFMMFCWFIMCILVYLRMILKSPYGVPSLALLNTLIFFCTFDNMIAQTFLGLQLMWPLLLPLLQRRVFSRLGKAALKLDILEPICTSDLCRRINLVEQA